MFLGAYPWPSVLGRPLIAAVRSLVTCRPTPRWRPVGTLVASATTPASRAAPCSPAGEDETDEGGLSQSEPSALPNRA